MRTYKEVQTTVQELESATCDRCKKVYDDIMELQEFLHYENDAGYGSILGDGNKLRMDLCQYCVKEVLGPFIRVIGNYITGGDFDQDLSFADIAHAPNTYNAADINYICPDCRGESIGCDQCHMTGKVKADPYE